MDEIVPEDQHRVRETIHAALRTRSLYFIRYAIRTPAGDSKMLEAHGKIIYNAAGEPERMIGVCTELRPPQTSEISPK
jgi:hypothetical protein